MMQEKESTILNQLCTELKLPLAHIKTTVKLLQDGNTVPFIARYRKEATGGLDEEQIRAIEEGWQYKQNLWKRKDEVLEKIEEQGKLTEELKANILGAKKLQEVEDYYRPYKAKRRTKATVAKEKGLEPLALWLLQLTPDDPEQEAQAYLSAEKEVTSTEEVLQGAMDIVAEHIADDPSMRQAIRNMTFRKGKIISTVKKEELDEKNVYAMYYDYAETVPKIVPHRVLAMNRGEKEDVLKVNIETPAESIAEHMYKGWVKKESSPSAKYVQQAVEDSYKRLIAPAVEREIRRELTEKAEEHAIQIFSKNLKALLLQAPIRGKTVLGLDPAYRTGCKVAVADHTGKLVAIDVIYPTPPVNKVKEAKQTINKLLDQYPIDLIAIGNGTASRETEQFVADLIQERSEDLAYMIINEAGASVYSASKLAKEEFPKLDVSERSAISIARRLQDPLAELVKIDPKSIGVGQYQHDVTQSRLDESLTFVVESAVNQVGVDVNTASVSLLQYVSGLNKSVAQQIVKRREEEGIFLARTELKKVPRLGAKTFEQAIGFLRIFDGKNPFDATPIHPESYREAEVLLKELGHSKDKLGSSDLVQELQTIDLREWSDKLDLGLPTLEDIREALLKPGRDPREELAKPLLQKDILKLEHLSEGLELEGTVRNVVDFGAFVDIGLKNDGLVHISQLSQRFVKHPMDVVSVGDIVTVWVHQIDVKRDRVGLTMIP